MSEDTMFEEDSQREDPKGVEEPSTEWGDSSGVHRMSYMRGSRPTPALRALSAEDRALLTLMRGYRERQDPRSASAIWSRLSHRLFRSVYGVVKDEAVAEEVTSHAMWKLFQHLEGDSFDAERSFSQETLREALRWLRCCARRRLIDRWRGKSGREQLFESGDLERLLRVAEDSRRGGSGEGALERARELIEMLRDYPPGQPNPRYYQVMRLRYLSGTAKPLGYPEIAEELGESAANCRKLQSRAIAAIKELLSRGSDPEEES